MKSDTFEDYLQSRHADQYAGLDDDMADDFGEWVANLDPQEFIDYGDHFGAVMSLQGFKEAKAIVGELFNKQRNNEAN